MLEPPEIPGPGGLLFMVVEPAPDGPGRWRYGFPYDDPVWHTLSVVDHRVRYDDPEPGWLDGLAGDIARNASARARMHINAAAPMSLADPWFFRFPLSVLWRNHLRRKFRRPLSRRQRRRTVPGT